MKSGCKIFLVSFIALGLSWYGFVFKPAVQLGGAKLTSILNSADANYPAQRSGDATLGLQVYRASGCAACHTTQVRQESSKFDVTLTSAGKIPAAAKTVSNLVSTLKLIGLSKEEADDANAKISAAGGKTETKMSSTGADIARGWGLRRSVAADFLYDQPVQLGSVRVGPDLANIGVRSPDTSWHLRHLYAPKSVVPNSTMPAFRFLFAQKKTANGFETVPTDDAKNLVAYLLSLRADAPLYEAPFTAAQVETNAPAPAATNSPAEKK